MKWKKELKYTIKYKGTLMSAQDISKLTKGKIGSGAICHRISQGWSIEKILNTPTKKIDKRKNVKKLRACWYHMKHRCYNKNNKSYKRYGGRGILVCKSWYHSFDKFYKWAIENGYHQKLTLDRKDNDNSYKPSNCRWVTMKVQANNRRSSKKITFRGKTQTMAQWADEYDIAYSALQYRIDLDWPIKDALTKKSTPKTKTSKVKYKGKEVSIFELSKKLEVTYDTLVYRLLNLKLDVKTVTKALGKSHKTYMNLSKKVIE